MPLTLADFGELGKAIDLDFWQIFEGKFFSLFQ